MMNSTLVSILLCLLSARAFSQKPIGSFAATENLESNILTCTTKKEGIYASFNEFFTNSPSVSTGYYVEKEKTLEKNFWTGDTMRYKVRYWLKPSNNGQLTERQLQRRFWGFCKNDTVYFAIWQLFIDDKTNIGYLPLAEIGRYCFFNYSYYRPALQGGYTPGAILNMNNGTFYGAEKNIVKAILAKEPELLAAYISFEGRGLYQFEWPSVNQKFIHQYNLKHGQDVKF